MSASPHSAGDPSVSGAGDPATGARSAQDAPRSSGEANAAALTATAGRGDSKADVPFKLVDTNADDADLPEEVDERPHRRREWSGGGRSVALPLLIVAAIVGAIWYLETGRDGGAVEQGHGIVALEPARNSTGRPAAAALGRAAPDFLLERLGGGELRLSDLRGQVVLVNFWASWCAPCRSEMPEYVRLYDGLHERGLELVAVDLQEAAGQVQAFVDEFGMRFPVLFDRSGGVARTYHADQLPVTVLIDRQGVVRMTHAGPVTPEFIRAEIDKLL